MTRLAAVLLCITSLLVLGSVSKAAADYYRYTDSHGAAVMTNKLDSVPLTSLCGKSR